MHPPKKVGILSKITAASLAASMALTGVPAFAQSPAPSDINDLLDARGGDGEFQMQSRGYIQHHVSRSGGSIYSYWWQSNTKKCVRVRTEDGRYQQIDTVGNADCGQKDADGMSTGAGVAVGAAVLLGIAALASKSHHREDRNYDERQTADFERGFRDGQYHHPYSNYNNSRDYSDGYNKGVDERGYQSSYRPEYRNYQRPSYGGGNWVYCASEEGTCRVPYNTRVRFGVNGRFNIKEVDRNIRCTTSEFGDPANGERKRCEYDAR